MFRGRCVVAAVAAGAALATAAPGQAVVSREDGARQLRAVETCVADCWVTIYRKSNGSGWVEIKSPTEHFVCRNEWPCIRFVNDPRPSEIIPHADPGATFRGWEGCPSTSGEKCIVAAAGSLDLCAHFTAGGVPPDPEGCPPPGTPTQPPPPPPPPDTRPPITRITAAPAPRTRARRATFRFRANEHTLRFQCRLDRQAWRTCRSPKIYVRLRPGPHTFRVRAVDLFQNVDRTPATRGWRIIR